MASKGKKTPKKRREPVNTDAELEKALQYHRMGQLREAEAGYRKVLEMNPGDADALHLLGVLAHQTGRPGKAVDLIGQAIRLSPHVPYYHDNMGNALKSAGRTGDAIESYRKALELKPDYPQVCNNLAIALRSVGRLDEAISYYRKALELNPNLAETCNNLANALKDQGRTQEAIAFYKRALDLKPDYPEAHNNLGSVLHDRGEIDDALSHYRAALGAEPGFAEAMSNMGVALMDRGSAGEAALLFRQAIEVKPDYAEAYNNLGNALKDLGEPEEAVSCYGKAVELKPTMAGALSNCLLALHYSESADREMLSRLAREWGRSHASPPGDHGSFGNIPDPGRRIKLGYVSGDFRRHPVASFMDAPLRHHDRDKFEVYCYYNHHVSDDVTGKIRSLPLHWRSIAGLQDETAETMIREDGIDILVDLSGHTAGHRLRLFGRKPVPLQVTWLGYSDTTGLEAMDYILADSHVIGEEDEGFYTEKVVRLPHSYLCYAPETYAPEVGELRALSRGYVTFGSFNNIAKVSAASLEAWSRILQSLPGARLCIKTSVLNLSAVRDRYLTFFTQRGVEAHRIDIAGKSETHRELLARYGDIDIALDTFPYGGTTTTAEALWMGIPVITLAGETFVGRVGRSILTTTGLTGLIARTPDEYVAKAIGLARDLPVLSTLRAGLRRKVAESPFCDGERFTADLEAIFRDMWKGWCDGRASG